MPLNNFDANSLRVILNHLHINGRGPNQTDTTISTLRPNCNIIRKTHNIQNRIHPTITSFSFKQENYLSTVCPYSNPQGCYCRDIANSLTIPRNGPHGGVRAWI